MDEAMGKKTAGLPSGITAILWDLDGTLLDFKTAEKAAIQKGFRAFHLGECTDAMIRRYSAINKVYWEKLERGELTKDRVLEGRFEAFFKEVGIPAELAAPFNEAYQIDLGDTVRFMDDSLTLVRALKKTVKQYGVTNGTKIAQMRKLEKSGLKDLLDDVFISEDIGAEKPDPAFFEAVFKKIEEKDPSKILIVGDSLTSDMKGGFLSGLITCYYDPEARSQEKTLQEAREESGLRRRALAALSGAKDAPFPVDYEVRDLRQVTKILHADAESFVKRLEQIPLYGRKEGTEGIRRLLRRLGDPQKDLNVIHVAGTNGKGSCCAMLESVLRESGRKTGLFTSPHLISYTERIRVNGTSIAPHAFALLGEEVMDAAEELAGEGFPHPTFFEILTAMGLLYFQRKRTDVVILETGVGGRLDATNVVEPPNLLSCLITSISLDHTKVLGETPEAIAREKAGILRKGVPAVLAENPANVRAVIEVAAREIGAPLILASEEVKDRAEAIEIPLKGAHQQENLRAVLQMIEILRKQGMEITEDQLREGLRKTVWPGRMQLLNPKGLACPLLLDGAHNPDGARRLRDHLDASYRSGSCSLVFSALGKKDVGGIMKELLDARAVGSVTFTRIGGEPAEEMLKEVYESLTKKHEKRRFGRRSGGAGDKAPSLQAGPQGPPLPEREREIFFSEKPMDAIQKAGEREGTELVVVCGSLYLIGEVLEELQKGDSDVCF